MAGWTSPALIEALPAVALGSVEDRSVVSASRNAKVSLLCAAYFGFVTGLYGIGFWLSSLIQVSGNGNPVAIGRLVAIPCSAAVAA